MRLWGGSGIGSRIEGRGLLSTVRHLDGKGLRVGSDRGRFWGRGCSLYLLVI